MSTTIAVTVNFKKTDTGKAEICDFGEVMYVLSIVGGGEAVLLLRRCMNLHLRVCSET